MLHFECHRPLTLALLTNGDAPKQATLAHLS